MINTEKYSGYHLKRKDRESTMNSPLQIAARVVRGADRALTTLGAMCLLVLFLYACFALWDTWRIYDAAGVDEELLRYKPTVNSKNENGFAELMDLNSDVCAWLTVKNTNIDYPIVRGTDNVRYVNTNVYGDFSLSGSIFLDWRNSRDFSDSYSLLYGHHMDGDVMFGELDYFLEEEYFDAHPEGILYLPEQGCHIEFFACLQTDAYDSYIFSPGNLSSEQTVELLSHIQKNAEQYRESNTNTQGALIALSTCSDTSTNARTILFGWLSEISEDTEK